MENYLNKHQAIVLLFGGILATAVSITVFAYSTFQTKEHATDTKIWLNERLDRIENKIDKLQGE